MLLACSTQSEESKKHLPLADPTSMTRSRGEFPEAAMAELHFGGQRFASGTKAPYASVVRSTNIHVGVDSVAFRPNTRQDDYVPSKLEPGWVFPPLVQTDGHLAASMVRGL